VGKRWTAAEVEPFNTPWRSAIVNRVVDPDTFDVRVQCGFGVSAETRVRLLREGVYTTPQDPTDDGVNAFEIKGEQKAEGLVAMSRVLGLIQPGDEVRIFSQRGGKLDGVRRWLAALLFENEPGVWLSLGDLLLEEGHAVPWVRS
jgi:endonuclease YncB( thermonuclease family)